MRRPQHGAHSPERTGDIDRRWRDQCVDLFVSMFDAPFAEPSTDSCLCTSGISVFLQTNVVGILAVTIAGEATVTQILTQLVRR